MSLKLKYIIVGISLITSLPAMSQRNIYNWRLTGYYGYMNYRGDIKTGIVPQYTNFSSFGFEIEKFQGNSFAWQINYLRGVLAANDIAYDKNDFIDISKSNFERGLNFKTGINDLSLRLAFYTDNNKIFFNRSFIAPYIFAGIGISNFTVYSDLYNTNGRYYYYNNAIYDGPSGTNANQIMQDGIFETNVLSLKTEGVNYDSVVLNIPLGIGLKFRLSERINIDVRADAKYYFTDYLDDISGTYPSESLQNYPSNPTGVIDNYRGNPNNRNDITFMLSASLSWNFGEKKNEFVIGPIQPIRKDYLHDIVTTTDTLFMDSMVTRTTTESFDTLVTEYVYKIDTIPLEEMPVPKLRIFDIDTVMIDSTETLVQADSVIYTPVFQIDTSYLSYDSLSADSTVTVAEKILLDSTIIDSVEERVNVERIMYEPVFRIDTVYNEAGRYSDTIYETMPVTKFDSVIIDSTIIPLTLSKSKEISDTIKVLEKVIEKQDTITVFNQPGQKEWNNNFPVSQGNDLDNYDFNYNGEPSKPIVNKINITPSASGSRIVFYSNTDSTEVNVIYPQSENETGNTQSGKQQKQATDDEGKEDSKAGSGSHQDETQNSNAASANKISRQIEQLKELLIAQSALQLANAGKQNNTDTIMKADPVLQKKIDSLRLSIDSLQLSNNNSLNKLSEGLQLHPQQIKVAVPEIDLNNYDYSMQNILSINLLKQEIELLKTEVKELQNQLSEQRKTDTVLVLSEVSDIQPLPAKEIMYYVSGKSEITTSHLDPLNKIALLMQKDNSLQLIIAGYADKTGNTATNKKITQSRADAVKKYLVSKGISAVRIKAKGYGDSFAEPGANPSDRKVELVFWR